MRRILLSTFVASVAAVSLSAEVLAADWIVRGRGVAVLPDADSSALDLDAESNVTAEIDITRFLSPNLALELILATSTHEVTTKTPSLPKSLGSATLLPPTLTLQYHFSPNANVRPYAGVGINYSVIYDETGTLDTADIDLDNSFGPAAQFGIDWMLSKTASINFDIKYVNIETEIDSSDPTLDGIDIDINPWIIGIGAGYHF